MGNGRVEPIALRGRAEDEPSPLRCPATVPEIVPADELRRAADDAGVAVDTAFDLTGALPLPGDRVPEQNQERQREAGEHERHVPEPFAGRPERLPEVQADGVEPHQPVESGPCDRARDRRGHDWIESYIDDGGEGRCQDSGAAVSTKIHVTRRLGRQRWTTDTPSGPRARGRSRATRRRGRRRP